MTLPSTLSGLLHRLFTNHQPELLADQVASRSRPAVWDRVSHRMPELSGAEARGYIRARGAGVIEVETDRLIAEEGTKAARHRNEILHIAGESVIRLVLEQSQVRRSALPKRRAA
jgi:hypothetical protein